MILPMSCLIRTACTVFTRYCPLLRRSLFRCVQLAPAVGRLIIHYRTESFQSRVHLRKLTVPYTLSQTDCCNGQIHRRTAFCHSHGHACSGCSLNFVTESKTIYGARVRRRNGGRRGAQVGPARRSRFPSKSALPSTTLRGLYQTVAVGRFKFTRGDHEKYQRRCSR